MGGVGQATSVHGLFESQAEKTPDAVSVVIGTERLTYRELNERANRLAHHLMALGVGPEVLVGISMERSPELIVGILGILKAGGAYVPLDPTYPKARLGFMLEDADVPVLLTQEHLTGMFPEYRSRVVCLDRDGSGIAGQSKDNPRQEITPSNLVYVMYTSGSTGKPKGVCIEHRGVIRLVRDQDYIDLGPDEVILQITSISFDLSTFEIWGSLLNGGRLVLLPPEAKSLHEIGEVLIKNGVTTLSISTGLFHLMVDERLDDMRSVRQFLPAGEALSAPHVKKLLQRIKGARVINGYGPTENTSYTTCYRATDANAIGASVPIGKPISGTTVYILDENLRPVEPGEVGELYTGGTGLARNYWNRPELTAERFVRDPFSGDPDARLYKVGDLVRALPDGNIEYLGRIDNQVKIRGYRVELGEIETVLRQHPAVQQAVVLLREDRPGEKRLTGYVVRNSQYESSAEEEGDSDDRLVDQWRQVYEETYTQKSGNEDEAFNTIGWNSSYTGQPIPEDEMRQWVGCVIERIKSLNPDRVIELGCGTGLLMYPIAPGCSEYFGTDFSKEVIRYLERRQKTEKALPQVKLAHRPADNFEGIEPQSYDTLIINGVAQHFPSIDYFLRVIEGAIRVIRDGGHIFIGDGRSLPLLEAYQTSVSLYRSPDSLPKTQLRHLVQQRLVQEEELVIDPAFYIALKKQFPRIRHIQVQPREGRYHNELTKFRFDATIHIGTEDPEQKEIQWLDWRDDRLTVDKVRALLAENRPEALGVRSVPNARVAAEAETMEWLNGSAAPETVGQWRAFLSTRKGGVEPQDLWDLGAQLSYTTEISWCRSDSAGSYDFVFLRRADGDRKKYRFWSDVEEDHRLREWGRYTNQALKEKNIRQVESDIRGFLESGLPDYMVPAAFVFLKALPLTPNGKVDTRALPAPSQRDMDSGEAYVAPKTQVEELLSVMWSELLGLENLGTQENFFRLGGHSLLAAKLMNRVREAFQVELPLHLLFKDPTIAGLACEIELSRREGGGIKPPPIRSFPRTGGMPLSLSQEGNSLRLQIAPTCPFLNVPMMLHYAGMIDVAALEQALDEFVRRHEIARTTFSTLDRKPVQVIHPSLSIKVKVVDLRHIPDKEREAEALRVATGEARIIFDLEKGPLLRALLIRMKENDDRLLITLHHQICDGYSIHHVLFRELIVLYESFSTGKPSPLPELTVQYADYAMWEREYLQDHVLEPHLTYWKRKLAGLVPLQLPYDYPRPVNPTFQTSRHFMSFGKPLTDRLKSVSMREGVTMFMTLLAAYQTLLFRNSAQTEIPVMTFATGLHREEFKNLLGIFVNFLPISTKLDGDADFRELLKRVRESTLDAYSHHELPFPILMKEVKPELFAGEDRAFQAVFVYDSHMPAVDPKWSISWMEVYNGAGIRDLSLEIQERSEGLVGLFQYRAEVFKAETIEKLAADYLSLLDRIVVNLDAKLSEPAG
jgi:amino acid adenylation domain-containing protein